MTAYRLRIFIAVVLALLFPACSLPVVEAIPSPAAATGSTAAVCFYRDLDLACVQRATAQSFESQDAQARALLEAMLAGPAQAERAQNIYSALPDGASLADVSIAGSAITIKLDLPESFLYGHFDPLASDMIVRQVMATLDPLNLLDFTIQARDREGNWQRLSYFLFEPPPLHKDTGSQSPISNLQSSAPVTQPSALSGKAVYVSAGHGWYWSKNSTWATQRVVYQDMVEDFNNAEVVNQYLIQYLRNAGADVWPVRESDMNTGQIIITRNSPGYADQGGWTTSTQYGYYGPYRYAEVSAAVTATATWTFTPPASGKYAVYAWYAHGSNRAPDAHYLVQHDGGASEVHVDQTVHGDTWRYIGTFPFAGGVEAHVLLTNQSAISGRVVVADAIRIGGGMGSERGDTPPGYSSSGRPRWEEAARYWAKYQGAPPEVYDPVTVECTYGWTDLCDDVTARPRYAEWEKPTGEDAVYISWHSNGYIGTTRGTESYIYDGAFSPGSDTLQTFVHSTLVSDIRAGWDPAWTDRGMKRADLGEVRLLSTMPGVLLEVAYHDQVDDANALKDPRFEQLAARAVYKGIVQYFANRDGIQPVFLPEPPKTLAARNLPSVTTGGAVRLDWLPSPTDSSGLLGDAATSYRVYTSSDGLGWSNGVPVAGTVYTLTHLAPGQLIFARVTGVNAGGESFPTPIVGARVGWPAHVLIVDGFGRIDRRGLIAQDDGGTLGVNERMFLDRINNFGYVVQHGTAIVLPFDSANRRALGTLPVALAGYTIVDWFSGEEQSQSDPIPPNAPDITLSAAEQTALQNYIAGGGSLLISGSEIGYDLAQKGLGAAFYANVLRATYWGDDAGTYTVTAVTGSIFDGLGTFRFDDGTHGSYNADWPDLFFPASGAASALTYGGGTGRTAALQYDSGGCSRLVYFGFPFETIYDAPMRQTVMSRAMGFLGKCLPLDTTIQSPEDGQYYNHVPLLQGSANAAANIASVRLQIISSGAQYWNGVTWLSTPAWVTATGATAWGYTLTAALADGWYTVTAQSNNIYGFADITPASAAFAMDTVSPTGPAPITPTGGITVSGVGTTFVYSPGQDSALAGYVVEVDGHPFTTTTDVTFRLPVALANGAHTWRVWAFDRAGNQSPPSGPASFAAISKHFYLPLAMKEK